MFGRFLSTAGKMPLAIPGLRNTGSGGSFAHFYRSRIIPDMALFLFRLAQSRLLL